MAIAAVAGRAAAHTAAAGSATRTAEAATSTATTPTESTPASAAVGARFAPIIYRPPGISLSRRVPLLLAFHGVDGTPATMERMTGFDQLANRYRFVVAYLGSTTSAYAWWGAYDPDYMSYISAELARLVKSENIDPTRIYATGFSAGGLPSYRSACELNRMVAAIAVVGDVVGPHRCTSLPQPVSELIVMGTADYYPVQGGTISGQGTTDRFLALDGCRSHSDPRTATVGSAVLSSWGPCNAGSSVGLYVVQGGTHTWPYQGQANNPLTASNPDAQFDASAAIWAFLSAHHASPMSASVVLQKLSAIGKRSSRAVAARFHLGEQPVTARLTVSAGRRQLAAKRLQLRGTSPQIQVKLPPRTGPGRYSVTVVLTDSYARTLTLSRTLKIAS